MVLHMSLNIVIFISQTKIYYSSTLINMTCCNKIANPRVLVSEGLGLGWGTSLRFENVFEANKAPNTAATRLLSYMGHVGSVLRFSSSTVEKGFFVYLDFVT